MKMAGRSYSIHQDELLTHAYVGFNANPIGAFYQLKVHEVGPFYCTEKELSLAILELARYAQDQFELENESIQVLPLQAAWDTIEF
jgi:hypothetical protein